MSPRLPAFVLASVLAVSLSAQRDKPCLVPWQRNLEDALALVQQTGKPLLICVNMDGEGASEQLAWYHYRDPDFVKLMRGFIPLIVSGDQRNPRDWDDHGRRIPDWRFGRVVNYEHMTIEPKLRERYFGTESVAPRHVGVSKDGVLLFDIFLTRGFDPVVEALKKHGKPDAKPLPKAADMSEAQLLESPDAGHRDELEARFWQGDEATRARFASQALSKGRSTQHPEILRMALQVSPAVRKAAVTTIAANIDRAPEWLWLPAFRACGRDPALLKVLETALVGKELGSVIQRLRTDTEVVDVNAWSKALAAATPEAPPSAEELGTLEKQLNELEAKIRKEESPELKLSLASTTLRYGRIRILQREDPTFILQDACTHAKAAASSKDDKVRGRALAVLAWASHLLNDEETAGTAAKRALPLLLEGGDAATPLGVMAFRVCAERGQNHAAWEVLMARPDCTEQQILGYLKSLQVAGAHGFQPEVLERGLELFPVSGSLHQYLRYQQLRDWGAESLERCYARMKRPPEHAAALAWYAGVASLHAAARHVQNQRDKAAVGSYQRAVQHLEASAKANRAYQDSANHYICLAEAGRARVLADGRQWTDAAAALEKGLATRPPSKDTKDTLGNTPVQNANYIYNGLLAAGKEDEAKGLQEAVLKHGVKVERRARGRR